MWLRGRTLIRGERVERELWTELEFHIAREAAALEAQGLSRGDAAREARRRFGSTAAAADRCRDERGLETRLVDDVRADVRFGMRLIRRAPLFVGIAGATVAIGVAAATSIFSVVDAVLWHSLPFAPYDRIALVWRQNLEQGQDRITLSPADFIEYESQAVSFASMGAVRGIPLAISIDDRSVAGAALQVTPSLMTTLGIVPTLGRRLGPADTASGGRVAMVTYEFWQRALNGDSSAIGREITLRVASAGAPGADGRYTVVGVLPRGARVPYRDGDVWIPLALERERSARGRGLLAFGQLRAGVSFERASGEIASITRRIAERFPAELNGQSSWLVTLRDEDVGDIAPTLGLIAICVALLCVIVCTNLGNMLLSKLAERDRELSVRRALGASNRRLIRQVLTESLMLGAIGGVAGIGISFWLVRALAAGPATIPRLSDVRLGAPSIAAAAVAAVTMSLAFGLIPAARLARQGTGMLALRAGGSSMRGPLREILVGLEVATAFAVLVGAGLAIASARRLEREPVGYDPSGVLTFRVALPRDTYASAEMRAAFNASLLERLREAPGVDAVGAVNTLPQLGSDGSVAFAVEGGATAEPLNGRFRIATPGYFASMRIPVFDATDALRSERRAPMGVALSRSMREQLFGNAEAIGRRIRLRLPGIDTVWLPVVAVVGDVRQWVESRPNPTIYLLSVEQQSFGFAVRTSGDPLRLSSVVRDAIASIDPMLPMFDVMTMPDRLRDGQGLSFARFRTILMTGFGVIVMMLAVLGIYGVVRHGVVARTKEFGIRVALGASRRMIMRSVLAESLRAVIGGLVLGAALALGMSRAIASALYGVAGPEWSMIAGVAVLLAAIAAGSAAVPAWRAGGADPLLALRGS